MFVDPERARTFIQSDCSYKWFKENVEITETDIRIGNQTGKIDECTIVNNGTNNFTLEV